MARPKRITSSPQNVLHSAPERCGKCREAIVGVRKCRCQMGGMPRGKVWINGILRFIDGCETCGSTLHTACFRQKGRPT